MFPDNDYSTRSKWRRLLLYAQYALLHNPRNNNYKESLDLVSKCAIALDRDRQYKEAEELGEQVL
jgi:hypothetical protein